MSPLSLTNSSLTVGTNLTQTFSSHPSSSTNLDFLLPGSLPICNYSLTVDLTINGSTGRVLSGLYRLNAIPVALNFGPPPVWSLNGLSLGLEGQVGSSYLIQASSDLVTWTPMRYFVLTNSPLFFTDLSATNLNARFYQAVIP